MNITIAIIVSLPFWILAGIILDIYNDMKIEYGWEYRRVI